MSEYTRHLRDAIFHARNAQRSIERAQAKAPAAEKSAIDGFIRGLRDTRRWARDTARRSEHRGGIRT